MVQEIKKYLYIIEYTSNIILYENEVENILCKAEECLKVKKGLSDSDIMMINYLLGVGNCRIFKYSKSIQYLDKAIEYAKKLYEEYYLAKAYGWNSINHLNLYSIKEYEEKFNVCENKLRYLKKYDDLACFCSRLSCNLFRGDQSKEEIQLMLNKTEEYLKKFESQLSADCYLSIGQIYSLKLNNFDIAVDHYYKALQLSRKYNMEHVEVVVLYQLGIGYFQLNLKNEAAEILMEIVEDDRYNKYYTVQASTAIELIKIFTEKRMYLDRIDRYIEKSKIAIEQIGHYQKDQFRIALDLCIISYQVNIKNKDLSKALEKLKIIEQEYHKYGNKFMFTNVDYDIEELYGNIFYKFNDYTTALKHHILMLNIANKYEVMFLIKAYNYLAKDYEVIGNYKEAYFYSVKANKALVEIEHRELIKKYVRVYKNYERLKEHEKEKEDFFATLSHELKTPINVIYATMQLLNLYKDRESDEFKSLYLKYEKSIKQNCLRMSRIVNNIIDITKIDSGAFSINLVNYDIIKLTREIASSVLSYVEINDVNLQFSTEIKQLIIACDPNFIERILLNLLSNAIKFSNEKGNIYVSVYLRDKYVVIEVKDNGIGIPINMQNEVFERFVQIDKSLKRKSEGSGIGLSLVKKLVEIQNGYIELESEPLKGSIFRVYLPNEDLKSTSKVDLYNEYNVNIEKIHTELSDIYMS